MASLGYRSKAPARCAPICAEAKERRCEDHRRKGGGDSSTAREKKTGTGFGGCGRGAAVPPPFDARRHRYSPLAIVPSSSAASGWLRSAHIAFCAGLCPDDERMLFLPCDCERRASCRDFTAASSRCRL